VAMPCLAYCTLDLDIVEKKEERKLVEFHQKA